MSTTSSCPPKHAQWRGVFSRGSTGKGEKGEREEGREKGRRKSLRLFGIGDQLSFNNK